MLPWNKKISFNLEDMEKNLIKNASSSQELSEEDKYYQALEEISKAAEMFESAGLVKVASLLDDILSKFSKAEDYEKHVKNLEEHGWMFDESDDSDGMFDEEKSGIENREFVETIGDKLERGEGLDPAELDIAKNISLNLAGDLNPSEQQRLQELINGTGRDEDFEDT